MNAHEIRYSPDATRVALGWPGGVLAVHAVDPSDGSPAEELARVIHHKDTLVRVGWLEGDRLASVSEDGAWAISDAGSGEVRHSGKVAGEYLSADLSPSGGALFVYAYGDDEVVWRIDTADGTATEGPAIDDVINVTSTVYAVSDQVALLRFFEDADDGVREGLAEVDFAAKEVTPRTFANGPSSDVFTESFVLAIDPARGIGLRPDYEPAELSGDAETGHVTLRVELFDLASLERQRTIDVLGWPRAHLDGPLEGLKTSEPGTSDYADAQDWLIRKVPRAVFVPGTPHVWLAMAIGAVRRVSLDGERRDVPVFHGGGADTGPPSLNDVFARNLMNLRTLGVSDGGEYVGFGNPNDFFAVEALDLDDAETPIKLPPRRTKGPETESPGLVRFAGDRLVVFDRGEGMHLADGASGEVQERIALGEYYGEASDVALAGDALVIAVAGGSSLAHRDGETTELAVPPHALLVSALSDERVAFVHHEGAAVVVDLGSGATEAVRAPEEEGDDPDYDWDAFEQRWGLRGAAALTIGGTPHLATVDENDEVRLYSLDGSIEVGESFEHTAGRMVGGADWLAIAPGSEVTLLAMPGGAVTASHPVGQVGSLCTGDQSGALYVFDDESGELSRIEGSERQVVFTYRGASCPQVDVSERLDRIAVVTAAGPIELYALSSGEKLAELRVEPKERERVLVKS